MIYKILKWLYGKLDQDSKKMLLAVVLDDLGDEAKAFALARMNSKEVVGAISGISDGVKLVVADKLLGDVLKSKTVGIDPDMAEKITTKIAKSTGNKIYDFMLRD